MKTKTKIFIKISVALAVVAAIVVSVFAIYYTVTPEITRLLDLGGTMVVTPNENPRSTITLFAGPSDMQTEDGKKYYTMTATIGPSGASNKAVDWSVAWKNSSSTWASGKSVSDYVTITPTSDGALTAKLKSSGQAFGEQIIVTVKSRSDTSVKATATVDWYGRIAGYSKLAFANESSDLVSVSNNRIVMSASAAAPSLTKINFTPTIGVHTADDTFTYSYKITFSTDFKTYLQGLNLTTNSMVGTDMRLVSIPAGVSAPNADMLKFCDLKLNADMYKHFLASGVTLTNQQKEQMLEKLYSEYSTSANNPKAIALLSVTASGAYSSYSAAVPIYYDGSTFPVTSVTLNDTVYGF